MTDQASALREIVQANQPSDLIDPSVRCQLVAVTSGKGGVGKTNVVVNLAIALRRTGRRVAILDADFGLSNVDVLLGLAPQHHLGHVIDGTLSLRSIIIQGPDGVDIIPASSGIQELTRLNEMERTLVLAELRDVMDEYDFVFIDTAAGISDNVIGLLTVARRVIVVSAPEPTAIVDAYALIKVLLRRQADREVLVLVNSVRNQVEASKVFEQLNGVVEHFLKHRLRMFGFVLKDDRVQRAVREQVALLVGYPDAPVSECFGRLALTLLEEPVPSGHIQGDQRL